MLLLPLLLLVCPSYDEGKGVTDYLRYQFETHYAPKSLKEEAFGWDLKSEIDHLKTALSSGNFLTWKRQVKNFFNSMRDVHVQVTFQSTGESTLPFHMVETEGRYFVVYVDEDNNLESGLQVGDEILGWNGEAIDEFAHQFFHEEFTPLPFTRTWFELSNRYLTLRDGAMGVEPESGEVEIDYIRQGNLGHVVYSWKVTKEHYPNILFAKGLNTPGKKPLSSFERMMTTESVLSPSYSQFDHQKKKQNPFKLGGKTSCVPLLGPCLWKSWDKDPYYAYLFETPLGAKVGYLRIPHFSFDKESDFFCLTRLVRKLKEQGASLLIIDLFHNPGGFAFNMYAAVALFIDQPVKALSQYEILSNDQIETAMEVRTASNISEIYYPKESTPKKTFFGYPVDDHLEKSFFNYANFIFDQASKGAKIADLYPFLGIEEIYPHRKTHFDGPLLVLIDSLDFSCADFFPAILKDAGRAVLFGTKTGGAGGALSPKLSLPNRFGIANWRLTTSILTRPNGEIVEGIGVQPDIEYKLKPCDYLEEFESLRQAIVEAAENMLGLRPSGVEPETFGSGGQRSIH